MKRQKRYWYVIKTKDGFATFIEAEDARKARDYYSDIYYGTVLSARRATANDWRQVKYTAHRKCCR